MTERRYLYCRRCDAVVRLSGLPPAADGPPSDEGQADATVDDAGQFLARHDGHRVERLVAVEGRATASGPWWDPMIETFHEVVTGSGERFVVHGRRAHIDDARTYRAVPGVLVESEVTAEIDRATLRGLVDAALFPHVLPERKRDLVVESLAKAVSKANPAEMERVVDVSDDPDAALATVPPAVVSAALREVGAHFDDWERARIAAELSNAAAESAAVLVRRRLTLVPLV